MQMRQQLSESLILDLFRRPIDHESRHILFLRNAQRENRCVKDGIRNNTISKKRTVRSTRNVGATQRSLCCARRPVTIYLSHILPSYYCLYAWPNATAVSNPYIG